MEIDPVVRDGDLGPHHRGRQGQGTAGHHPTENHRYREGRPPGAGLGRRLVTEAQLVPLRVAINGKLVGTGTALKLTKPMGGKKLTVTVIARKTGYVDGRSASKTVVVKR
jgi:hypothetical protein